MKNEFEKVGRLEERVIEPISPNDLLVDLRVPELEPYIKVVVPSKNSCIYDRME